MTIGDTIKVDPQANGWTVALSSDNDVVIILHCGEDESLAAGMDPEQAATLIAALQETRHDALANLAEDDKDNNDWLKNL